MTNFVPNVNPIWCQRHLPASAAIFSRPPSLIPCRFGPAPNLENLRGWRHVKGLALSGCVTNHPVLLSLTLSACHSSSESSRVEGPALLWERRPWSLTPARTRRLCTCEQFRCQARPAEGSQYHLLALSARVLLASLPGQTCYPMWEVCGSE